MFLAFNIAILGGLLVLLFCEEVRYRQFSQRVRQVHASLEALANRLRSPFATLLSGEDILISKDAGSLTAEQRAILERMQAATDDAANVLSRLFMISRIDGEFSSLHHIDVDMRIAVQRAIDAARPLAALKKQIITFVPPTTAHTLRIDPLLVHGILSEILLNACAYSEDRKKITVKLQGTSASVTVIITDTGIGISPTERPQIFTKLFRGAKAAAMRPGKGLGLYFAKRSAEKCGGTVKFTSREKKGSEFTIQLPKKKKK